MRMKVMTHNSHGTPVPPPELVAEARRNPGGWVYEIDGDMVDDPNGAVPPEAIIGAWKVDQDGNLTGEYDENPNYRPSGNA
jgi:hypothetical protein